MFRYLKIATPLCAAAIFAAACGNPSVEAARALKVEGNDAAAEAAREYRRLAYFEDKMMWDDASAIAFREKALTVQRDGLSRMLTPAALNEATPEEIKAAYRYLSALMASGAAELAPKSTGQAVARLDCWAEQSAEGYQKDHIALCRDGFRDYADEAASVLRAAGRDDIQVAVPVRVFTVTFPPGSTVPAAGSREALDAAAEYAAMYATVRVVLGGHADRAGDPAMNQRLSQARAESVARLLRARGVNGAAISTIGFGETYPRATTPDGQKSVENRRVEIVIGPAATL